MKPRSIVATLAAVVIAGLQPSASAVAGTMLVSGADSYSGTLIQAATDAGTAAGIVSQCRSDAQPIRSAFERAVDAAKPDSSRRQSLWLRYETAESSTLMALANTRALSCSDMNIIIHDTLRELGQPLS